MAMMDVKLVGQTRVLRRTLADLTRTYGGCWSPSRGGWIVSPKCMDVIRTGDSALDERWVRQAIEAGSITIEEA